MSIAHSTHAAHRTAFGPRNGRSEAAKALHVAESILLHEAEGCPRTLTDYGIDPASPYGARVRALLRATRAQGVTP